MRISDWSSDVCSSDLAPPTAISVLDSSRHTAGMTTAPLLWGLLFGSIGLGCFLYGTKPARLVPPLCGLALMIYPYFVPNVYALALIGVGVSAVPYFISDWRRSPSD